MIKSPLRYPGGKSKAIKFLQQYIPKNFKEYREPFFGGGSVGFYVQQHYGNVRFLANDLNYELYCFWNTVKNDIDKMYDEVLRIRNAYQDGRVLYNEILERRNANLSEFQRGVDFFILNRITFSGVADSGGYSNQSFHKRFTLSSIERMKEAHKVIKNFKLCNADFEEIIASEGIDVFIFLDPPYYSATKSKLYGKNGDLHIGFDHVKLSEMLKDTKHKFLMTYDNSEYIRELYKDFHMIEWDLQYGMNNYKQSTASKGKELLISNYSFKEKDLFDFSNEQAP